MYIQIDFFVKPGGKTDRVVHSPVSTVTSSSLSNTSRESLAERLRSARPNDLTLCSTNKLPPNEWRPSQLFNCCQRISWCLRHRPRMRTSRQCNRAPCPVSCHCHYWPVNQEDVICLQYFKAQLSYHTAICHGWAYRVEMETADLLSKTLCTWSY